MGKLDEVSRMCLRTECDLLKAKMKQIFLEKNRSEKDKKQCLNMPQSVKVGNKVSRLITLSPLMIYVIFQKNLDLLKQLPSYENKSNNKKGIPGYLHLASPTRVDEILTVEDVHLSMHSSWDIPGGCCEHALTSIASLRNLSQPGAPMFKAYGWDETESSITFMFNLKGDDVPMEMVTFNRPKFVKEKIVLDEGLESERTRVVFSYKFDEVQVVGEKQLVSYVPVCIRVHCRSLNSFRFVGARIAYRVSEDGFVFLLSSYSS